MYIDKVSLDVLLACVWEVNSRGIASGVYMHRFTTPLMHARVLGCEEGREGTRLVEM